MESKNLKIIGKLGDDGEGTTLLAEELESLGEKKKYIVIKVNLDSKKKEENFKKQLEILKLIKTNFSVIYYDSFIQYDKKVQTKYGYIVTDYCSKGNILDAIYKSNYTQEKTTHLIWTFFISTCLGLHNLHSKGIIHKYIQPNNIFIFEDEKAKIGAIDVSEFKSSKKGDVLTKLGEFNYMSPELLFNDDYSTITDKTDIWSLGCLLYELAFKKKAFDGELFYKQIKECNFSIPQNCDPEIKSLIERMIVIDPKKRPSINDLICDEIILSKAIDYGMFEEIYQSYLFHNKLIDDFTEKLCNNRKLINKLLKYLLNKYIKKSSNCIISTIETERNNQEVQLFGEEMARNLFASQNKNFIDIYIDSSKINLDNKIQFTSKGIHQNIIAQFNNLLESAKGLFDNCSNLYSIDLTSFDTSAIKDMRTMFKSCTNLSILDLKSFNTSKVVNMNGMFEGCSNLTFLNLTKFDTSQVKDMGSMFASCSSLSVLNLDSFNTKNVCDMSYMFQYCFNLTYLDLSMFKTNNVKTMSYMFDFCSKLKQLDLSYFNTKNLGDISFMMDGCSNLISINLYGFEASFGNETKDIFQGCNKLNEIIFDKKYENLKQSFKNLKKFKLVFE